MIDFNIKNLIFQDNEIEIKDIQEINIDNKRKVIIKFQSINPKHPISCEKCGGVSFRNKDYYQRKVKHISFIDEIGGNITNGIVEAKNNVVKTIIKNSYGVNNFKMLRAKVLETERTRKERK